MVILHVTYPDGETAEARFALTLADAFSLYDTFPVCDGWIDGCEGCENCEAA